MICPASENLFDFFVLVFDFLTQVCPQKYRNPRVKGLHSQISKFHIESGAFVERIYLIKN